jgi:hypothetical protein
VATLYKTLFGVHGSTVDLAKAEPPGGHPVTALPQVRPDGTVVTPENSRPAADQRPDLGAPDLSAYRRDEGGH